MENLIKMDDLGGPPLFLETPIWMINIPKLWNIVDLVKNYFLKF